MPLHKLGGTRAPRTEYRSRSFRGSRQQAQRHWARSLWRCRCGHSHQPSPSGAPRGRKGTKSRAARSCLAGALRPAIIPRPVRHGAHPRHPTCLPVCPPICLLLTLRQHHFFLLFTLSLLNLAPSPAIVAASSSSSASPPPSGPPSLPRSLAGLSPSSQLQTPIASSSTVLHVLSPTRNRRQSTQGVALPPPTRESQARA